MALRAMKITLTLPRISGMSGVTASRMRRLTRLRVTLLPILRLTEKPMRGAGSRLLANTSASRRCPADLPTR